MIKIGITGGIGSGKTTFCKEWEKLGVHVVYADDFAKQLMNENEELREKITKVFGKASYDSEGNLNRAYLAEEAFAKDRVEELNALVHPVLKERLKEYAHQKEQEGVDVLAYEAAILLNEGRPGWLDFVIIVTAEEEQRLKRTAERDRASIGKIQDRIDKQPDFEELLSLADFVIENSGTLQELQEKAEKSLRTIQDISGK
ncbi:MAG: dephospho-CoA kinase [Balneola sp.]|nr:dephospho-CoA kinase [Balneola sp.]|tara:strand:- start:17970 stop:18572 length:603 start_codon:yes stop_codon:yes gene_type:complete